MNTELLFQETEEFARDRQQLDAATQEQLVARVNEVGRACLEGACGCTHPAESPAVRGLGLAPVAMELAEGYDSSLYTVEAAPDVRLVLAIDDDPIFGQVILTLLRAVPSALLEQASRDVVQALAKSLPRFMAPQEVPVG